MFQIAAEIYKSGFIKYDNLTIPLHNIEEVVLKEKEVILILVSGRRITIGDEEPDLVSALKWMFS